MAYPGVARIELPILQELVATGGDDDVRFIGGLDAKVTEDTKISIIPAVAGGAER